MWWSSLHSSLDTTTRPRQKRFIMFTTSDSQVLDYLPSENRALLSPDGLSSFGDHMRLFLAPCQSQARGQPHRASKCAGKRNLVSAIHFLSPDNHTNSPRPKTISPHIRPGKRDFPGENSLRPTPHHIHDRSSTYYTTHLWATPEPARPPFALPPTATFSLLSSSRALRVFRARNRASETCCGRR